MCRNLGAVRSVRFWWWRWWRERILLRSYRSFSQSSDRRCDFLKNNREADQSHWWVTITEITKHKPYSIIKKRRFRRKASQKNDLDRWAWAACWSIITTEKCSSNQFSCQAFPEQFQPLKFEEKANSWGSPYDIRRRCREWLWYRGKSN